MSGSKSAHTTDTMGFSPAVGIELGQMACLNRQQVNTEASCMPFGGKIGSIQFSDTKFFKSSFRPTAF